MFTAFPCPGPRGRALVIAAVVVSLVNAVRVATAQTQAAPPSGGAGATSPPTVRKTVTRSAFEFGEEDKKLLASYKLSTEKLDRFEVTTRRLQDAAKRDPGMRAQFEAVGSAAKGRTLAEGITRIESGSPAVTALFKECNTTARDYVLTSFSLVTAAMTAGDAAATAAPPPFVPAENVAFFRANRARIETDFRSFQSR